MFNIQYIHELLNGQLSEQGYKHFVLVVGSYIRKYGWPRTIVVTNDNIDTKHWKNQDIIEITHQFFEWCLSKRKLDNLSKIPNQYLSYYFLQILISFVANRIKEEQQKKGLSFARCRDLVVALIEDQYFLDSIDGRRYVFYRSFSKNELKPTSEIDNAVKYLSKIPINANTKHIKPLVKLAIDDVLESIESAIPVETLIDAVYHLLERKTVIVEAPNEIAIQHEEIGPEKEQHQKYVQEIIRGLTKDDAKIISNFIFQNDQKVSIADMAARYQIPKSTFHYKIDTFKKKIASTYRPENEQDAIIFLQNLFDALDKHSK